MKQDELLEILQQGADVWNEWRHDNPETKIDLRSVNLMCMNLVGINLSGADLSHADLSNIELGESNLRGVNFRETDLSGASLSYVDLCEADLREADLRGVDFTKTDLRHSSLRDSNLTNAYLMHADLSYADLNGAILKSAIFGHCHLKHTNLRKTHLTYTFFEGADFYKTLFSSKTSLNLIAGELSQDQMANMIFADETQARQTDSNDQTQAYLQIKIAGNSKWTPFDVSIFLWALQLTYNKMYYIMMEEGGDYKQITAVLESPQTFVSPQNDICVKNIQYGSLIAEFLSLTPENITILQGIAVVMGLAYVTDKISNANLNFEKAETEKLNRSNIEADELKKKSQSLPALRVSQDITQLIGKTIIDEIETNEECKEAINKKIITKNPVVEEHKPEFVQKAMRPLLNVLASIASKEKIDITAKVINPANDNKE